MGGNGGNLTGGAGSPDPNPGSAGGGGGTQSAGGAAGFDTDYGEAGSLGNGGGGGNAGGGGGGYYGGGGGGGGSTDSAGGGGGGGSSFTAKHAKHVTSAVTTATATVTITYASQPPPKATTKPATGVKSTSATLNGSVNPEGLKTTYYFEYGTTKSYGHKTGKHSLKAGTTARSVSALIHGLKPSTTYHFRVVAHNAAGTADGKDLTFTTPSVAPAFTG
jgi:hypothetical protein